MAVHSVQACCPIGPPSGGPSRVWDAVFVGSGTGSLAAAATLARAGYSVLVLEAHTQVGGLTHTFQRKGVRWGTGLHYTGWPIAYACDFPDLWHALTGGLAPWVRLPDDTDTLVGPDGTFIKRGDRDRFRADLHAAFPGERAVIDRYLNDVRRTAADYLWFMTLQAVPPLVERLGLGWWLGRQFLRADRVPLVEYMDRIGASDRLRRCLWFTWGNFGGVPSQTSFGAYSVPTEFMMDGLWTAARGSRSVGEAFVRTITAAGGEVRRGTTVTGLVFRGGRVVGVRVGDEAIAARRVISGIGARETYRLLVPESHRPRHADRIAAMKPSCSILTLYLALDEAVIPRHGLTGVNYWVERVPGSLNGVWDDLNDRPPWFVFSLAARFQPEPHAPPGLVPAEVFAGIEGRQFARWQGTRVMKRGSEYADFKAELVERTLEQLDRTWPGIRGSIRLCEAATPLTIESYTRHGDGAAYGIAPVPGRYSERGLRVASGVPGLLLTGQDVAAAGVIGAFYGGLAAASVVLRRDARSYLLREPRGSPCSVGSFGPVTGSTLT